jgi:hypothetical protein
MTPGIGGEEASLNGPIQGDWTRRGVGRLSSWRKSLRSSAFQFRQSIGRNEVTPRFHSSGVLRQMLYCLPSEPSRQRPEGKHVITE